MMPVLPNPSEDLKSWAGRLIVALRSWGQKQDSTLSEMKSQIDDLQKRVEDLENP